MPRTGIRPPAPDAAKALCCECCGSYDDGRYNDCGITHCPIYSKMPYRKLQPNFDWIFSKWRRTYDEERRLLRLSEKEYVEGYLLKSDGTINLGYTPLFRAKCYRCCGDFLDGRQDCCIISCPIYYWMPYRNQLPNIHWLFFSPYSDRHRDKRKLYNLSYNEYIQEFIVKRKRIHDNP